MALSDILGGLISSGMGGKNETGPNLISNLHQNPNSENTDSGVLGTGLSYGKAASLAGLAYLGYKAWTSHQQKEEERAAFAQQQQGQQGQQGQQNSGGFWNKVGEWFGHDQSNQNVPNEEQSLLLIEAMIAAARADGDISPDERNVMMQRIEETNPTDQERATVQQLLNQPPTIDQVISQVHDQNTAEQVFHSACFGMPINSANAAPFFQYLGQRLNLPIETQRTIINSVFPNSNII